MEKVAEQHILTKCSKCNTFQVISDLVHDFMNFNALKNIKQAISARERALCQLTVCFEFQSRSDRRKRHKSCALEMVFGRKLRR